MPPTKLDELLKSAARGGLNKIVQRAQNLDSLTVALQRRLAPDIAPELLAANVREDGEMVVVCSSSAWASRIRFHSDVLLEAARATGFDARTMRVTVSQPR